LSNIAPPAIRRTVTAVKFIQNIQTKPHLPVHLDIFHRSTFRLQSRRPIWSIDTGSSTKELWKETWEVNPTVNSFIIDDPTDLVPGYDLPRREWCLLNRFRSGTRRCAANLHQWGYTDSPLCICGDTQFMSHIVNDCPVNKFDLNLLELHIASDAAKEWLRRVNCIRQKKNVFTTKFCYRLRGSASPVLMATG